MKILNIKQLKVTLLPKIPLTSHFVRARQRQIHVCYTGHRRNVQISERDEWKIIGYHLDDLDDWSIHIERESRRCPPPYSELTSKSHTVEHRAWSKILQELCNCSHLGLNFGTYEMASSLPVTCFWLSQAIALDGVVSSSISSNSAWASLREDCYGDVGTWILRTIMILTLCIKYVAHFWLTTLPFELCPSNFRLRNGECCLNF